MISSIDGDNTTKDRIFKLKIGVTEEETQHPEHKQTTPANMKLKKQNNKEHKPAYQVEAKMQRVRETSKKKTHLTKNKNEYINTGNRSITLN